MKGARHLEFVGFNVNLTGEGTVVQEIPGRPQKTTTLPEEGRPENNNALRSLMLQRFCRYKEKGKKRPFVEFRATDGEDDTMSL
ncbi:hypothetical protein CEXT_110701 [Caerostris extrusa]|uniref:Uncharacterized protein n=1 Tax=Caerostris extrusa TaxID=172846 RepID=A0AAV4Y0W9_CAEEX|nr:hypothetical protein CEXT_110701 [Caerostris extrusa]